MSAGACEVLSPIGQLRPTISPGYGYTAIIAAFIGRLNPLGIILSSLLIFASLRRWRIIAD